MARALTETFEGGHLFRFGNQVGVNGNAQVQLYTSFPMFTTQMDGLRSLVCEGSDTRLTMALPAATEYFIGFFFITTDPSLEYNGIGGSGTTGNHRILIFTDGGVQIGYIRINPLDQKLQLMIGGDVLTASSTQEQVFTAGTLYHIQVRVKCAGALSIVQVKLDDVLVIDWTGSMGGSVVDQLQWCGPGRSFADTSVTSYHFFDTIIINDTVPDTCPSGFTNDSWPGVRRIKVQLISGPGTYSQFTPVPTVPNYQNVDEVPNDGDTTVNYALTTGLKDSFPTSPHGLSAAQVTFTGWFQEVIARNGLRG